MISDDNDPDDFPEAGQADPDAHGQASLLLVESLLHELVEKGFLTTVEAIGVATSAAEVKEEIASQAIEADDTARHSLRLIARIIASFELDLPSRASENGSGSDR